MIYPGDHPLLDSTDLSTLVNAFTVARKEHKSIIVPFHRGRMGNPVILDAKYKNDILALTGDIGCRRLIQQHPDEVWVVEMANDHVIRDIDRFEDYESLLGLKTAK
jgi:molybdenum cofactor cytidylyltransferase